MFTVRAGNACSQTLRRSYIQVSRCPIRKISKEVSPELWSSWDWGGSREILGTGIFLHWVVRTSMGRSGNFVKTGSGSSSITMTSESDSNKLIGCSMDPEATVLGADLRAALDIVPDSATSALWFEDPIYCSIYGQLAINESLRNS